jgi:hypothetical protein
MTWLSPNLFTVMMITWWRFGAIFVPRFKTTCAIAISSLSATHFAAKRAAIILHWMAFAQLGDVILHLVKNWIKLHNWQFSFFASYRIFIHISPAGKISECPWQPQSSSSDHQFPEQSRRYNRSRQARQWYPTELRYCNNVFPQAITFLDLARTINFSFHSLVNVSILQQLA